MSSYDLHEQSPTLNLIRADGSETEPSGWLIQDRDQPDRMADLIDTHESGFLEDRPLTPGEAQRVAIWIWRYTAA